MLLDLDIWLDWNFISLYSHKYPNFIQVWKFMKIQLNPSPIDNQEHIVKIQLQVTDISVWSEEWFILELNKVNKQKSDQKTTSNVNKLVKIQREIPSSSHLD